MNEAVAGFRTPPDVFRRGVHVAVRGSGARRMSVRLCMLAGGLLQIVGPQGVQAQATFTLSADPRILVISEAIAGFGPIPAADQSTTYSLHVEQASTLMARLDGPLPEGLTLRVQLETPAGASAAGAVTLTTLPQAVIAAIPPGTYTGLGITYELRGVVTAGVVPLQTRNVVFEIVAGQ